MSGTILSSLEASSAKKRNEIITPTLSSNFSVTSNQDQNLFRQNGMKKNEGKYQKYQKTNPKENPVLSGGLSMVREESISPNSTIHNTTNCRMSKIKVSNSNLSKIKVSNSNLSNSNLSNSDFSASNVPREKSVEEDDKEEDEEEEDPVIARMRKIPCLGIIMAFISGIFFATAGFTVCLIPNIDATLIVVFRSFIQICFYLPAALYSKANLFGVPGERSAILQRSIFGFICFTLSYYALAFLSLSDASAIAFSAPVYVSIFACVLLREPCGFFQIVTIVVTITGVILISRPTFIFHDDIAYTNMETPTNGTPINETPINETLSNLASDKFTPESRLIGVILSFATAITMAYTFIAMRRLQKTPVAIVINYFSFFCLFFGVIVIAIMNYGFDYHKDKPWLPLTAKDYGWLVANGFCGVGGQLFLVLSLKLEEAGLVSLARTFDIVMAFIYQVAFLHEAVYATSIVGAIIVCSGVVACALKKTYGAKPHFFNPLIRFVNFFGCNYDIVPDPEIDAKIAQDANCIADANYITDANCIADANYENHAFDGNENIAKLSSKINEFMTRPPTMIERHASLSGSQLVYCRPKTRAISVPNSSVLPDSVQITTTVQVVVVNPNSPESAQNSKVSETKQPVKSARTFRRSSSVVSEIVPTPY